MLSIYLVSWIYVFLYKYFNFFWTFFSIGKMYCHFMTEQCNNIHILFYTLCFVRWHLLYCHFMTEQCNNIHILFYTLCFVRWHLLYCHFMTEQCNNIHILFYTLCFVRWHLLYCHFMTEQCNNIHILFYTLCFVRWHFFQTMNKLWWLIYFQIFTQEKFHLFSKKFYNEWKYSV